MIKYAALIDEGDSWINSRTLISESGIHAKCTTIESLFGHSLSGYMIRNKIMNPKDNKKSKVISHHT